ncbi:coproporphyrinogen dehydrogenase HemZ [Dehalobacter sp. DCM]|uniref:coproporphyrinogen dehydrogenase HemZ n=1 Tax=Dehalobacter sp. DCM TaxID=2907827 RepID=UPI003081446A|nr:coproporphyrinogen dehydrogenase HemZ [Dehalobacter sp. DCM]
MAGTIQVRSQTIDDKRLKSCFQIIAAFFPGAKTQSGDGSVQRMLCERDDQDPKRARWIIAIEVTRKEENGIWSSETDETITIQITNGYHHREYVSAHGPLVETDLMTEMTTKGLPGKEPLDQILMKRALCRALEDYTGKRLPWGILTGIRPGKLIERIYALGYSDALKDNVLDDLYLIHREKSELLQKIAKIQKPYKTTMMERHDLAAVYLSIPFCPTRCFYCSFPSNTIQTNRNDKQGLRLESDKLSRYLKALFEEISLFKETMHRRSLLADSIYIGGGTPTVLDALQLEQLLQRIRDRLPLEKDAEFTVEAGRPDTITREKLSVMKEFGVNRISINPQTMQNETLKQIGRRHTAQAVIDAYALARQMSDWHINMDLILGLPNEGRQEITESLEKILILNPENITLHALALKRGSAAWENQYAHDHMEEWQTIQTDLTERLESCGYVPYYLYKQKNSVGNLENIGYAQKGKICRYNIAVIEELQNILGLGAGSSSKIFIQKGIHENIYHPIDLRCYEQQRASIHDKIEKTLSKYRI